MDIEKNDDIKKRLLEADGFFAQTSPRKEEDKSDNKPSNLNNNKSTLSAVAELFMSARLTADERYQREKEEREERERSELWKKEWLIEKRVQDKKESLAKDIQGMLLNKYAYVAKEIIPTLSCDVFLRKKLIEFLSKYIIQIDQIGSVSYFEYYKDEEIEKAIETLKKNCDDIEEVIIFEYEKFFNSLYKEQDETLVLELKNKEMTIKAERDLMILKYKTLFYEYIVCLEKHLELSRKRPKL